MIKISETIENLPHSPTLWANDLVHQKRAQGEKVFHMGFGESPFPVQDRLKDALSKTAHRCEYLPAHGSKELIEVVREYYRPLLGDEVIENTDIVVAPGTKMTLYALQMAIEGDLVMPVPSWVSYAPQAKMLHTDVIKVPTVLDDEGYHIDAQQLQDIIRAAKAAGKNPSKLILNSPHNPTGLKIPEDELKAIAQVCREEQLLIISDEIYGLVSFDGTYTSIAKFAPDITAVSTGISKHLSLGGWRLGVAFIPKGVPDLYPAMRHIISELWSCVSAPIQQACVEAYKRHQDVEDHIRDCTAIHQYVNQTISKGLKDLGIACPMAQGAFYNYPDFAPFRDELARKGITTSQGLHEYLLTNYNLATLPAIGFGADPEVLALRLSGCDYDGAKALEAYRAGAKLDREFLETYAPNILGALDVFAAFIAEVTTAQRSGKAHSS